MKQFYRETFANVTAAPVRAILLTLFCAMLSINLLSCKGAKKPDLIGTWIIHSTTYDTTDHTAGGLAAHVWATTVGGGGATWEFMTNDSAVIAFPPDNDERHYYYALQPDGKTVVLEDNTLARTDTLEARLNRDSLEIYDRSRRIRYFMTRGGAKMNESP